MPSPLEVMLAADRIQPCPWCGAQVGKPCRADRGSGAELTKAVHTHRKKLTPAEPASAAEEAGHGRRPRNRASSWIDHSNPDKEDQ